MRLFAVLVAIGGVGLPLAFGVKWCPPVGTALPAPTNVAAEPAMRSAVAELRAALDEATAGRRPGLTYDANVTSSSVGVLSLHDDFGRGGAGGRKRGSTAQLIFQHHHTAPARNTTAGTRAPVDADTVYRVGSVSKAVTTLALLQQLVARGGRVAWDDPVTKFLPELAAAVNNNTAADRGDNGDDDDDADPVERIRWDQVTLRGLACQLGGVPRHYTLTDFSVGPQVAETAAALGLPPPSEIRPVECGANQTQRACTKQEYLSGVGRLRPVFPPYFTPSYSNLGFALLGAVIEAVAGKSYDDALAETFIRPLNLTRTSVRKPQDDSLGIIPLDATDWEWDLGPKNPAGSLYMSLTDLLAFGRAVLASELLPRSLTRRWLKPCSFTASRTAAVGAPWEIGLPLNLTRDGRLIEVYAKGGNIDSYAAHVAIVPDLGLVVAALVAAPPAVAQNAEGLANVALRALAPAIDAAAHAQARQKYAGLYVARNVGGGGNGGGSGRNSNTTTTTDTTPLSGTNATTPASNNATAAGGNGGRNNSTGDGDNTLRLVVDDDAPGLRIAALTMRGVTQETRLQAFVGGEVFDLPRPAQRLYPAGLKSSSSSTAAAGGSGGGGSSSSSARRLKTRQAPPRRFHRESFRALFSDETPGKTEYGGLDLCAIEWLLPSFATYASRPIDEFVVHVDAATGRAERVELPAWQIEFERVRE